MCDSHKALSRLIGEVALALSVLPSAAVPAFGTEEAPKSVRIGVLAKRGPERCLAKWGPTAEYLTSEIPSCVFTIVPLDYGEVHRVVEQDEVDFVLANPSFYVELEIRYGVNRLATLKNLRPGGVHTVYGGVIFRRADRNDIKRLADLKGKTFMAVNEGSLGGWRMAWRELKEAGIEPYGDLADLQFGGTHDTVVYAVRDRQVDAGTVRTDTLERMNLEGKIRLEEFHVIHEHGGGDVHLPLLHSTRPYPEWPLAKVKHTPDELAQLVAVALLSMPADSPAAVAARCAGWTVPLNYQPVHECLKELRVGPYRDYGKITLGDVLTQYWAWIASVVVLLAGMIVAIGWVLRLLSERKRAEEERAVLQEQLHQAQKMEAIGQLAGGVAHDFNNLLTTIFGYTALARATLPEGHDAIRSLRGVEEAAELATGVTRSLLTFSCKTASRKDPVELRGLVGKAADLLRRVLPAGIELVTDTADGSPVWVHADSTQMQQVVMNLAINARDAMPEGGTLRISVSRAPDDGSESARTAHSETPALAPRCQGPVARLAVTDTGTGMSPEVQERIFEPFFTTKPQNRGTGLGLSIIHGIVKDHDGHIEVQSEPGRGTTFTVVLPSFDGSAVPDAVDSSAAVASGHGETVLLAEDSLHVRSIMTSALESLRYEVVQASDGASLMEHFERHRPRIRLLVVDVDLPKRNGLDCLREIRAGGVRTPAIVITAGADAHLEEQLDEDTLLLRKPFQISEFGALVGSVLGGHSRRKKQA